MADAGSSTGLLFAAGFAVQRVVEILDPLFDLLSGGDARKKRLMAGLFSSLCGCALSGLGNLRILTMMNVTPAPAEWADIVVTGLAIGGGTEGVNSLLKYASYKKDQQQQIAQPAVAAPRRPPPTLEKAKEATGARS
ncbi:MAG: hypothetical protein JST92_22270 [Deltaproteobacteria bacterium]|nr:hypothetical protein [Deltaproteobacteria bacterium]